MHYEPDAAKELLQTIDEEAERLNKLVGNLLDMSRLQTGALSLDRQPVGVEELVASAAVGLPYAGARLEIDVPETLPRVLVDPALTERAIANLMANALAFSPPESVVRAEGGVVGDRVDLRIVDVGPGIAAKDQDLHARNRPSAGGGARAGRGNGGAKVGSHRRDTRAGCGPIRRSDRRHQREPGRSAGGCP